MLCLNKLGSNLYSVTFNSFSSYHIYQIYYLSITARVTFECVGRLRVHFFSWQLVPVCCSVHEKLLSYFMIGFIHDKFFVIYTSVSVVTIE